METRKIKFSLVYRDMWQSSGKYLPRVDQLVKVAPHIVEMGCFARVETNGGGFEQINLLFGENPNNAVRKWTQPFNDAGIQTHMLDRSLNGLRMSPVPADVRQMMYKVKKSQGTDITRPFCGLNDPRNILDSIKYAKDAGMIAQAALSLTYSKVHTVEYYVNLADTLIKGGADEICLKDMAGIGRPVWLGKIVSGIKKLHPEIPLQYHSHSGPGFALASILEVCRAGVEYVDVAMEPLSWGTGHVDLLAVHAMLKDAGFDVPEINMDAYMKVRSLTQSFIDDFLGYYINPKNRFMNSLLIGPGLPGGMMGSLMADLESNLASINKWKTKNNQPTLSQDDLLVKLFNEVEHIWPIVGYPPLVTPYSQYVKNLALMNVMQLEKGKQRWSMIADNIWDMLMGKGGKLPGELGPELKALAKEQGKEEFTENPQSLYPNALDTFRKEMDEKGWEYGQDEEELFELAMHPEQYRAYKSGEAKKAFEEDLAKRREEGAGLLEGTKKAEAPAAVPANFAPSSMIVDVDGEKFKVSVAYGENGAVQTAEAPVQASTPAPAAPVVNGAVKEVVAPLEGKFYLTKESSETPIKVGDDIKVGDLIGYVEAMKTFNAIKSDIAGKVVEVAFATGAEVEEDDVLVKIQ
ncbi:biotin/lipoyl-containing protein [Sunxiuqinia elliptica]|uniref:Pyruvate carboxylase subunit B n=1 Tax=Sunxiuqinia elliptica TaxID=655355 RepID=A0A4R6H4D5_9BACT|nr:biotin/lipoyl-containing protein [Sunxiuqinia elliptica]TDO03073.1 pyruvate carboxylase subunit B [Sunxiuqinia elliptica]TDO59272.1 pyruvate carboxylase subunit B [Sunxiuqinia elliptica]